MSIRAIRGQFCGRSDLTDFFPVWLDIGSALTNYPVTNGVTYRLSHAQNALNFIYTDLVNTNAGDYLVSDVAGCGSNFNQDVYTADTVRITAQGVELTADFLNRIAANPNKGIVLIEGVAASTLPLVLEVFSNNTVVARTEMPLNLSGVEQMFRHVNLRTDGTGEASRTNSPDNWPDSITDNHALAFVHGYNVSGEAAQGTFAETFKRLWQSGFNGRFVGISWFGNPDEFLTNIGPPEYHQSIAQAFAVADNFANAIADIKQNIASVVDVIAHSAGNMVVGSAVQDHGCTFRNYIALDAATPLEAYGADVQLTEDVNGFASLTGSGFDTGMVSSASFDEGIFSGFGNSWTWDEYDVRLHPTEWYRRFSGEDARSRLTWRNRFDNVGKGNPTGYNFYSSTEEVLRNYEGASLIHGMFMDWVKVFYNATPMPSDFDLEAGSHFTSLYVWVKQEKLKGRKDNWLPFFGGLPGRWGGWGFAEEGQFVKEFLWTIDLYPKSPAEIQPLINGAETNGFWESLKTEPLFRNQPAALFGPHVADYLTTDSSNVPGLYNRVENCPFSDWLLANAFPALSWSLGANPNPEWIGTGRNLDMSSANFMTDPAQWPNYGRIPGTSTDRPEWHHSDFKDIAYPHVYKLYEKWVELTEE